MNNPSLLEEIKQIIEGFSQPNQSGIEFANTNKRKRQLLRSPRIIIDLLSLIQDPVLPEVQTLYILRLIKELIKKYKVSLNLEEYISILYNIPSTSTKIQKHIAKTIAKAAFYVFLAEKKIILKCVEGYSELSNLDVYIYIDFITKINSYAQSVNKCKKVQAAKIYSVVRERLINIIILPTFDAVFSCATSSIELLRDCLAFGKDTSNCKSIMYESFYLDAFYQPEIYDILFNVVQSNTPEISTYPFQIIGLIARTIHAIDQKSQNMVQFVQKFINNLINNPDFIQYKVNSIHFANLILNIEPISVPFPYNQTVNNLMQFSMYLVENDIRTYCIIFPSLVSLFLRFYLYGSRNKNSGIVPEFKLQFTNLLDTYVDSMLDAILNRPKRAYKAIFELDIENTTGLIRNLWQFSLSRDEEEISNTINHIVGSINALMQGEITESSSIQISFLYLIIQVAFDKQQLFHNVRVFDIFYQQMIEYAQLMQQTIINAAATINPLYCELSFIDAMIYGCRTAVNLLNIPGIQNEEEKNMKKQELAFQYIPETFAKLLFNIKNNIEIKHSGIILNQFCNNKYLIQTIEQTEIPKEILETCNQYPCKTSIFMAFNQLFFYQNESGQWPFKSIYLQIIKDMFKEVPDDNAIDFLKVIGTLFCSVNNDLQWAEIYKFYENNFLETCLNLSLSNSSLIFLHFLEKISSVEKKRLPKHNPFETSEHYCFTIVQTIFKFLTNILSKLQFSPINIDESIYFGEYMSPSYYENDSTVFEMNDTEEYESYEILARIIDLANIWINTPFPNFQILELYHDYFLQDFTKLIIKTLSVTSTVSLYSFPKLFNAMHNWFSFCFMFGKELFNQLIENDIIQFIIQFSLVSFLSLDFKILNSNCLMLFEITRLFIENYIPLEQFQKHLLFTIKIVLSTDDEIGFGMHFIHLMAVFSRDFYDNIFRIILNSIENTRIHDKLLSCFERMTSEDAMQNHPKSQQLFFDLFKEFKKVYNENKVQFEDIPELSQYFSFEQN